MVYKGKSHLEMDENWGYPYDSGNHHMKKLLKLLDFQKESVGSFRKVMGAPEIIHFFLGIFP